MGLVRLVLTLREALIVTKEVAPIMAGAIAENSKVSRIPGKGILLLKKDKNDPISRAAVKRFAVGRAAKAAVQFREWSQPN